MCSLKEIKKNKRIRSKLSYHLVLTSINIYIFSYIHKYIFCIFLIFLGIVVQLSLYLYSLIFIFMYITYHAVHTRFVCVYAYFLV